MKAEVAREVLRQKQAASFPLVRGALPVVSSGMHPLLELVLGGCFLFFLSVIFFRLLTSFSFHLTSLGFGLGVLIGVLAASGYIFWPCVALIYHHHKTGQKPPETFLASFPARYDILKSAIVRWGLVEEAPKTEAPLPTKTDFRLWLGTSTGKLSTLWHRAGMKAGQEVALTVEEACQNLVVLGGIGSGKTTAVMQPLLLQCLDQGIGGLIFDIKGDVKETVAQFARLTGRQVVRIGPGNGTLNLLKGLTPEVAASFLKSAFLLGDKNHLDSFWVETATELCRNTLGLLSFLPHRYNLQSLHHYLFELETQEAIQAELETLLPTLSEKDQRLLKTYGNYDTLIFSTFDVKVKSGVQATVAQALAPFNHPDLLDAFCASHTELNMDSVLKGTVYLVDMPLSRWGLGGKVAYTFIKLRFFNLMQQRQANRLSEGNQQCLEKPVFFMCDEYQEIVSANRDGLSDLNFWDKSRASKTIGIISAQSIASFYAALGSHDLANALLQNFRQKLCLRTEDPITLEYMERLSGKARVKKVSHSYTSGANHSESRTISEGREGVIDAQLFRELNREEVLALLSLDGQSMDDILKLTSVYVE